MPSKQELKTLAVIPARYDSTRFPGKPLAPIAGKPMIQHVYTRVRQARSVSRVLVATDDERIVLAVEAFGGEAMLTRREHRCGTERVAEVAVHVHAETYVNVQGDEPLIDPAAIDAAVEAMAEDSAVSVATLQTRIRQAAEIMDPNVVKVVVEFQGDALYFSRAPIPWVRDETFRHAVRHLKHIGLYVYRRDAVLDYPTLPPGELERLEQLEQLRRLENGYRIRVVETEFVGVCVVVRGDVERVEKIFRERAAS
jgi:3-deoxy-manno-octulosonate cytidylyltransferase (CMP-KDO synthetase)